MFIVNEYLKMKKKNKIEYYDKKGMYLPSKNKMALKLSTLGPVPENKYM